MNSEKKLEKQFSEYQNLAKENKNIDVAALMLHALQNENKNLVPQKQKRWAYLISIGVPPVGFLFALKYYFDDKEDSQTVANVCVVLTLLSVLSFWIISKLIFSGSGASIQQIQQITPKDIQELGQ